MESTTATRLAGALAGRYVVEREVGSGGMAVVSLAHDIRHECQVALKVLRSELAAVIGGERFLAEIRATAAQGGRGSIGTVPRNRFTYSAPGSGTWARHLVVTLNALAPEHRADATQAPP